MSLNMSNPSDNSYICLSAVQQALRAGPDGNPPYNMKRALIFNGVLSLVGGLSMTLLNGDQKRKRLDEQKRDSPDGTTVAPVAAPAANHSAA